MNEDTTINFSNIISEISEIDKESKNLSHEINSIKANIKMNNFLTIENKLKKIKEYCEEFFINSFMYNRRVYPFKENFEAIIYKGNNKSIKFVINNYDGWAFLEEYKDNHNKTVSSTLRNDLSASYILYNNVLTKQELNDIIKNIDDIYSNLYQFFLNYLLNIKASVNHSFSLIKEHVSSLRGGEEDV